MTDLERYDRNISFFGEAGQIKIGSIKICIVGIGGLGTHIIQQTALLGVKVFCLVDKEELDQSNFNRYIGVNCDDPVSGMKKVDIGERIVKKIQKDASVNKVYDELRSKKAFDAIKESDFVFGCLDNEGSRLVLSDLCCAYEKPYLDLASEIIPGKSMEYGGEVFFTRDNKGCMRCLNLINLGEAQKELLNPDESRNFEMIYGVKKELLGISGPSVVSINGIIASLAVTEFMVFVTGIREPKRHLRYHGNRGIVSLNSDETLQDCYYCNCLRGKREEAEVETYLKK
jgi:molybdopterin/thiamine biosynthesis adenylyltransferase